MNLYLSSAKHIQNIRYIIPHSAIASDIAKHVLPVVKDKSGIVCETNAGLGFLTSELLDGGLHRIRLYETCSDFRLTLKGFSDVYPGKVELFVKDLFQIWKMSYLDKVDKGCRVIQFMKGIPKREWVDDSVMTIIGTMSKLDFMMYLFRMICFQAEMATYGRVELYSIMRPGDYLKLTAGPHCNLHTYQPISIFANVFCRFKLIEKYPRIAFLPWESITESSRTRIFKKCDVDRLYLVHIEFKKDLPLPTKQLLPFYFFVKQIFGRGTTTIIPKLEQWISGIGLEILLTTKKYEFPDNMDIYTKTGQLKPLELLEIFKVVYNHPNYANSSLTATIEAELLKGETIATDIADAQSTNTNML
ncbi:mtTFB2 [Trypoxylus dichotomus]